MKAEKKMVAEKAKVVTKTAPKTVKPWGMRHRAKIK